MQEKAGEQGAAYIPMPKGRGFTPHFDKQKRPTNEGRKMSDTGGSFQAKSTMVKASTKPANMLNEINTRNLALNSALSCGGLKSVVLSGDFFDSIASIKVDLFDGKRHRRKKEKEGRGGRVFFEG